MKTDDHLPFFYCVYVQRLGARSPREWKPNAAAKGLLAKLEDPLSFFKKSARRDGKREVTNTTIYCSVPSIFLRFFTYDLV